MAPPLGYRDAALAEWEPETPVDIREAEGVIRTCHREGPKLGPAQPRLEAVAEQIAALGTYTHTRREFEHSTRMAWRNSSRCIGRIYWRSLVVIDRRAPGTAEQIFENLVSHLRVATGEGEHRGRLRPVISVFGQSVPGRPTPRLWNDQLVRYAGYDDSGDPRYRRLTQAAEALGWKGKGAAFDLLPLILQIGDSSPQLFDLPEDAVIEVPLTHPELTWGGGPHLRPPHRVAAIHHPCGTRGLVLDRPADVGRPDPRVPPHYTEADLRPNFYLDNRAQDLASGGGPCPLAHWAPVSSSAESTPPGLKTQIFARSKQRAHVTG